MERLKPRKGRSPPKFRVTEIIRPNYHFFFLAEHGLSLVAVSTGSSSLWGMGFSLRWLLLLQGTGSRVHGP